MTDINFYHLQRSALEQALPKLLEKIIQAGKRAVVMARSEQRVDALNALLWTYDPNSFLPHGSKADGNAAEQPVWLTIEDENPNAATVLVLTDGAATRASPTTSAASSSSTATTPSASPTPASAGPNTRPPATRSRTGSRASGGGRRRREQASIFNSAPSPACGGRWVPTRSVCGADVPVPFLASWRGSTPAVRAAAIARPRRPPPPQAGEGSRVAELN